jgi:hypothetical protein
MKFVLFAAIVTALAVAEPVTTNPVVDLYVQRLELAKLEVEKETANLKHLEAVMEGLTASAGVVPGRTIVEQENKINLSKVQIRILQTKVKEANAVLEIARHRMRSGVDMPICPAERQ